MGISAYRYYVKAAAKYLMSEHADENADDYDIQGFVSAVKFRCDEDNAELGDALTEIRACLVHILDRWDKYDIDESIYSDLQAETVDLLRRVESE